MEHQIEAAKSGRASCKSCKKKIPKGELRFGEAYEGEFGSGVRWYHMKCAAKSAASALRPTLDAYPGEVENRAELQELMKASGKKQAKKNRAFPYAESAPSGRSTCRECGEKIPKGEFRLAFEAEIDTGSFVTTGAGYLHVGCASKHLGDVDWAAVEAQSGLDEEATAALRAAVA